MELAAGAGSDYERAAKERRARWSDEVLVREYLDMSRASWPHNPFYSNARREADTIGRELIERGVTEIPNIFGPIPVRTNHGEMGAPVPKYLRTW